MDLVQFYEILKEINIAQIIILLVGMWFFYSKLDKKIDALDQRLSVRIESVNQGLSARIEAVNQGLSARIDILSNKIDDVDRRLCRIEGSLATQGHCLFSQAKQGQRAE